MRTVPLASHKRIKSISSFGLCILSKVHRHLSAYLERTWGMPYAPLTYITTFTDVCHHIWNVQCTWRKPNVSQPFISVFERMLIRSNTIRCSVTALLHANGANCTMWKCSLFSVHNRWLVSRHWSNGSKTFSPSI